MQTLKKILFFFLFVLSLSVNGQLKFFNIYTNNGYDQGEGVAQISDSSYYITGSSSSFGEGPAQAFILHVDSLGNPLWSQSYGGAESDGGRRIFVVEGDGIYVAGHTNSFGNGSFDYYFFKTDMNGNLLYEKTFGGDKFEKVHGAVMLPDTSFVLVGETQSTQNEVEDMYILRLNKLGDTLWTRTVGDVGKDIARNICLVNDSTFMVVGEIFVQDSLMSKAYVAQMDWHGDTIWTKITGLNGTYSLNDVLINNGVIRGVGYNKPLDPSNPAKTHLYSYLAQLDGTFIFEVVDVMTNNARLDYVTSYGESPTYFYVAEQALESTVDVYPDGEDNFILRYSEFLFWDNFPLLNTSNVGQDQINQLIPTSDGGAISVGFNTHYGSGGNNITLIKIGPNDDFPESYVAPISHSLLGVNEIQESLGIGVYPNPVADHLFFNVPNAALLSLTICDFTGKEINQVTINSTDYLDFSSYAAGVYLVKIQVNEQQGMCKIIKY